MDETSMTLCFLTVTYWNDFDLLDRQLDSFDQYYNSSAVHYIVLNDDICHIKELSFIVSKHTKHSYHIVHRGDVYTNNEYPLKHVSYLPGWYTQQILKLLASYSIDSDFYCVLDSKSRLNGTVNSDHFVINNQAVNLKEHRCNIEGEFSNLAMSSYQALDANLDNNTLIQSIPPVVFKTSWVKLMLHYLNSKGLQLADLLLRDDFFCTEFYLYSAWVSKFELTDQIFWMDSSNSSIFNDKVNRRL